MRTPEDPASLGIELAPGERAIWTGRPTVRGHLRRSLPFIGIQAGGVVAFAAFALLFEPELASSFVMSIAIPLTAVVIVLGILIRLLGALRTRYALTDARLYVRGGLLLRRTSTVRPSALPTLEVFGDVGDVGSIGYRLSREAAPMAPPVGPFARVILLDGIAEADDVLRRLEAMRTVQLDAASRPDGAATVPSPLVGSAGSPIAGARGAALLIGAFFIGFSIFMLAGLASSGGLFVAWPIAAGATFFLAIGIGLAGYQVLAIRRERRILGTGQRVIGTITAIARGNVEVNDQPTYELRYRYEVMGRPFEGRASGLTYDAAHRVGPGDRISVAVDPAEPSYSIPVLEA